MDDAASTLSYPPRISVPLCNMKRTLPCPKKEAGFRCPGLFATGVNNFRRASQETSYSIWVVLLAVICRSSETPLWVTTLLPIGGNRTVRRLSDVVFPFPNGVLMH